jgi:hypothetical protein
MGNNHNESGMWSSSACDLVTGKASFNDPTAKEGRAQR